MDLQGSPTPQFLLLCAEFPELTQRESHPEIGGHQLHKHSPQCQVVGSLDHFPSQVGEQRVVSAEWEKRGEWKVFRQASAKDFEDDGVAGCACPLILHHKGEERRKKRIKLRVGGAV